MSGRGVRDEVCEMSGNTTTTTPPSNDAEEKKQLWDADEVHALLSLWGDESVQAELEASVRNERVYARISADLRDAGITRSPKQCREKVKKLKQEYKRLSEAAAGREGRKKSRHFQLLDAVLGRSQVEGRSRRPVAAASQQQQQQHQQQHHHQQHHQQQQQKEEEKEDQQNERHETLESPQDSEDASSLHSEVSVLIENGNITTAPQPGPSSAMNSGVKSPRNPQAKKRKRDAPDSVAELAKCMRESDEKYMDFLHQEMQADRELKERQMNMDRAQRQREAEALAVINRELISVLKQLGHALLARSSRDLPLD